MFLIYYFQYYSYKKPLYKNIVIFNMEITNIFKKKQKKREINIILYFHFQGRFPLFISFYIKKHF